MVSATWVVAVLGAGLLGVAVHEATHYAACRLLGLPARPTTISGGLVPTPAIYTPVRNHSKRTYRLVTLAPLVVFVPSAVAAYAVGVLYSPLDPLVPAMWAMWCVGTFPSPSDWEQAYHAADVTELQQVWYQYALIPESLHTHFL